MYILYIKYLILLNRNPVINLFCILRFLKFDIYVAFMRKMMRWIKLSLSFFHVIEEFANNNTLHLYLNMAVLMIIITLTTVLNFELLKW
jgi:hypothetical protein